MSPDDALTPAEIAALIGPHNHPARLTVEELDALTSPLTPAQLDEVVQRIGLPDFASQLPQLMERILDTMSRLNRDGPPEYEGPVEHMIGEFQRWGLQRQSEDDPTINSRSARSPPATPARAQAARSLATPATPASAQATRSSPSTPQTSARLTRGTGTGTPAGYIVDSPTQSSRVYSWFEAASLSRTIPSSSVHRTASSHRPRKPRSKAYAVFYGGEVGAFDNWGSVQRSISGHGVAIHAGFPSLVAAERAIEYARSKGWTADSAPNPPIPSPTPLPLPSSYDDNPLNSGSTSDMWRRELLKTAPSDIQLEAKVRSAQYRRNYKERCKESVKTTKAKPATKTPDAKTKPPSPKTKLAPAPPAPKHASASRTVSASTAAQATHDKHHNAPKMPRPRARGSPSPKSLAAIAAGESSSSDDPSEDESGYEVDEEDRRRHARHSRARIYPPARPTTRC
ncbi:hypothetical protein C8F04DRAFT_1253975 [Mycena alexandri]|uniref:Ribonuclease H1 N-terminal domain-containing protein n=1 Tax=Mycena alexandri TaxID=1745969 RepID=A0AAD6T6E3_9AGAR|nr:hypothetical protein C8F04DRAFT_1253975 [Mycena alexandri]